LVYELLEKGSVDKILKDEQSIEFDWNRRVNFIKDIVDALGYMFISIFPQI
jgi:hypothetical protein